MFTSSLKLFVFLCMRLEGLAFILLSGVEKVFIGKLDTRSCGGGRPCDQAPSHTCRGLHHIYTNTITRRRHT